MNLRRLWPWRARYEIVVIGRHTGMVTRLSFLRFRHESDGLAWIERRRHDMPDEDALFGLRPIEGEQ